MAQNTVEASRLQAPAGARHLLFFSFFFSVFVNILMLTGPLFMLQVYDRVLKSRSEETLAALLVLVMALYGLLWLLDFARARLVARYGARLQASLDDRVFRAQLALPPGDTRAEAMSASRDVEAVQAFYASPAYLALMDIPFTPIFLLAIYTFHPWLGWFALVAGGTLVAISFLNQILTAKRVASAQQAAEGAHRFADNARHAGEIIRSQGMLDPIVDRWLHRRADALDQVMHAVDWTGGFSTFTKAFRLSLQSLILALGAYLVLQGTLTAGAMIAASILLGRALAPIEQLLGRWPQVVRARQGSRSLATFLETAPQTENRTRLPRPRGRVVAKGVTITKPGNPPLLYNVSFTLEPGEVLGLIGRSGSGKTTIAKALLGLLEPTVGEMRLGGALLNHYAPADLGRYVGYLPQDPILITGTIAENIARMSLEPDSDLVVNAAKKANAHDLILNLRDGYETRVENNSIAMSGGQRQRIALARALYGDPVLLVLDEPNSALDLDGTEALNSAVRTMKSEGRSVIIMTHRPLAISECDTLMVIEAGRIMACGPRDEVLKSMMRNAGDIQRTLARGNKA